MEVNESQVLEWRSAVMPWQIDGTFLRVNPDYSASPSGELWGKDLAAQPSIKIIASRHDYHDQDIGGGIAACLNLDGLNAMRANLDMGAFKIVNLAPATGLGEIPVYGQLAGEVDYDDGTKLLTLSDRNGDPIDTTSIDLTGVGAGVTQITGDGSLELTPNPITGIGEIKMPVINPGQAYDGGISGVVIDDQGRVTQVTTGAAAPVPTNLGTTYGGTSFSITSSTGTNTVVSAAINTHAGAMTKQHVIDLEDTVRLSGDQTIDGIKSFTSQVFATAGMTSQGGLRVLNLPSVPGIEGVLWNNGVDDIVRVSP
jgi:hypothetical protein